MAGAGLHLIHTDKIIFARDGRWYADGEPVEHRRLANLFSRFLRRKPDGGFEIWIDERYHSDVEVEDTPYVVWMVHERADGGFDVELNDGSSEPLDPASLAVGPDDALSCAVKAAHERARLLRAAQGRLADRIEETPEGFAFRAGGRAYPIARG